MIKNYFKIAWRNIINTRLYSAINMVGLTIGLAVGMLILIWVQNELSYDKFNTKINQIYKVNTIIGSAGTKQVWSSTPGPVAYHAEKDVPGVISAVRVIGDYDYGSFTYKDKRLSPDKGNIYIDDSFFSVFDYQLIKGNAHRPFPNYRSVILTETVAKKYFDNADPIGKTILGDGRDPYVVSGIITDFPANSTIKADMLFSMELRKRQYDTKGFWKSLDEDWGDYFADTYLLVRPDASSTAIGRKLTQIHMALHKGITPTGGAYILQPFADIHLYNPDGSSAGAQIVKIFSIVAVLILLIACINYINLSTARAVLRGKEVSIRKVIGASRWQLFMQFVIETVLSFSIAIILAFVLMYALMPWYNSISGKQLHLDLSDAGIWKVVLLTIIVTLAASSIYPALLLSSFKPVSAIRGKLFGTSNAALRKGLVVCQFAFSIGLIIGTLVINRQLNFIQSTQMGYDREHVFTVKLDWMQAHYNAIRAGLLSHREIAGVATGDGSVVSSYASTGDTDWDGKTAGTNMQINWFEIDKDFIGLFNIKFAAGSGFTGEKSDSAHFILNETAVKLAGIKNPIGKRFKLFRTNGTIIGVVKDFHFASLKQAIEPAIFTYRPVASRLYVKATANNEAKAIKAVEKYFHQYNGDLRYDYNFLDDEFNQLYQTEQQTATLVNIFACIAIFISCLGLFGLATYTAQIRVKEIGIRKVLGASVANIMAMLSKDFLMLILLAFLIASPVAWYVINKWLQGYVYRVQLHWWLLGIPGIIAIMIALASIIFQSVKAAIANPVKSLRSE